MNVVENKLLVWLATMIVSVPSLVAQGFFDQAAEVTHAPERYQSPAWGEIAWSPTPVAETLVAGSDVFGMAFAVGSNSFGDTETRPYVRAMALAIADRLQPSIRPIELADYQLKNRRQPDAVATWTDRDILAAALWKTAWRIHTVDAATGLTLLDLAAGFDGSNDESMSRYRRLSEETMEGRWLATVRLPDGIDAPDISREDESSAAAAVLAEIATEDDKQPTKEKPSEAMVSFPIKRASIQVAGAEGGLVHLIAEVVEYDAATLRERKQATNRERNRLAKAKGVKPQPYVAPKLEMDFRIGTSNGDAASSVIEELSKARTEFVRLRADSLFRPGLGVEFEIAGGKTPATTGALSAAASVLLESMARGVTLAENAGAIGQVGFGSKLQLGDTPLASILRDGEGSGIVVVPDAAASDTADMAALGDLELLLGIQLLACRDIEHAVRLLSASSDASQARAIEGYAEIAKAAQRTPADSLVRNPLVKARLANVLKDCPEHLSAATLLKAGAATPATASLPASTRRLAEIEGKVRSWVGQYLAGGADISDADCAGELDVIRKMRPRLHPEVRGYANGLVDLIDDFRDSLSRGGSPTGRRADALRRSLDTLAVEVATLGLVEPQ